MKVTLVRVYTCTPIAFGGGPDFFTRDSGLLCRGLQAIGVESRAVMPGERVTSDQADLIRTNYANLESAEWWRSLHLDAVVLYAWGRPKFRKVAMAIRDAGIFLILNQDNGGLISPLAGFHGWVIDQKHLCGGGLHWLWKLCIGLSYGLFFTDPMRAAHLRCGDVIACVSPQAAAHYQKLCRWYGGKRLAEKVAVLPHAVEHHFRYNGTQKMRQIASVGRWDDLVQKRPDLLMDVIGGLVASDDAVQVVIAGHVTDSLRSWHESLSVNTRERVQLRGKVNRSELAEILNSSQIFYSPSAFESFGIAAAEALCCGCSVLAERSVSMAAFEWFVGDQSGSLSDAGATNHLTALRDELSAWHNGKRDAEKIAKTWTERLHADKLAAKVVEMLEK
ncbi:MAG: glycosyltransferase family 4 protein [Luteolibacter sp.]